MNVLITGGAGYVGAVLGRRLLAGGHQVRVLDSLLHGGGALLGLYPHEKFRFVKGDIRSAETVKDCLKGIEAVVHLAAIVGDPACARDPQTAREVNLDGALQLLEASQASGVRRFVFASTCSNYGKMADPSLAATEESPLSPVSLYAETKVKVEQTILEKYSPGMTATLMRFATVYGVSPRMRFDLTVNEFTRDLLLKGTLEVFGEQFWRPYIHVADAARGIQTVLEAPAEKVAGQVFNVGNSSQNFTKRMLVDLIQERVGRETDVRYVQRNEDPRDYRVAFEKIGQHLGFVTSRTVPDGIEEVAGILRDGVIPDPDAACYRN